MKTLIILLITSILAFNASAQDYKGNEAGKTLEQKLNDEYCTGMFHSAEGSILDVASSISAQSYLNIIDWLQGRVAGLQVYKNRYGVSTPVIRGGVPAVFIDEIQVSLSTLNSLNVNYIAIIKVIKMPFYGGFNSGHGAIAIYTLGGEEDEEETDSK